MEYTEHNKQKAVIDDSRIIQEFVEWLRDKKEAFVAKEYTWEEGVDDERGDETYSTTETLPIRQTLEALLYEFFKIDKEKIEEERVHMLDACRELAEAKGGK